MQPFSHPIDVLCAGHACFDLIFSVDHLIGADEKMLARTLTASGGGPAANAAVAVARLGLRAAFCGYLGNDLFGRRHAAELQADNVDTRLLVRGEHPTPLSAILVTPDGLRSVVNYRRDTPPLTAAPGTADPAPRVLLMDGHEPHASLDLLQRTAAGAISVLDAGSLNVGTRQLAGRVDHLVASQTFARQFSSCHDAEAALDRIGSRANRSVIITCGKEGLVWKKGGRKGHLPAFPISAVDTTGAGDAFHAAFAAGLARNLPWPALLDFASAAAALTCLKTGARPGLPGLDAVITFLHRQRHGGRTAATLQQAFSRL